MTSLMDKKCLECLIPFKGRADKKFCSDECRTSYNNRRNCDDIAYMRHVNYILRRNRRILTELNPEGKRRVSLEKLTNRGFNFNYFTSTYRTKEGTQYYYCYDQGYLPLEKEQCLLVVRKDLNT